MVGSIQQLASDASRRDVPSDARVLPRVYKLTTRLPPNIEGGVASCIPIYSGRGRYDGEIQPQSALATDHVPVIALTWIPLELPRSRQYPPMVLMWWPSVNCTGVAVIPLYLAYLLLVVVSLRL